ncbi:threonine ammonia-lyase [Marinivivus vitaminiproducens]|uniref:threonine ammonia-lyase n=1 Tax=Marinivivus vitaminiproducens TaxID=3035935 RepID=UPI00279E5EA5|nr:threonine ammonia-lyase [Geminicoccaceae bacterium SCSIO 64248]
MGTAAAGDLPVGFADIERAAGIVEGRVVRTPSGRAAALSDRLGCNLVLKLENQQYTSSFKDRGACVRLASLDDDAKRRGVIAMSAGNHAQGVAYHATRLGIPSTIVMPTHTPFVKVEKTRALGARVRLEGDMVDDAAVFARELGAAENLTFIHPYDDPLIIAGQGTVALEMLADHPDLDVLVVPIGGGGLISGIAIAAKAIKPGIEVVGVQTAACPAMYAAVQGLPKVQGGSSIADGIAVKTPGELTIPIVRSLVDGILLVEEPALEQAVLLLLELEKTVAEGAGAAGLAALLSYPKRFAGKTVGMVVCGGNIDSRLLSEVILRGLVRDRRLVRLRIGIPDLPGNLAKVAEVIARAGGNVVDVIHQRSFTALSVKATEVEFTIETRNGDHATEIATHLKVAGFAVTVRDGLGGL